MKSVFVSIICLLAWLCPQAQVTIKGRIVDSLGNGIAHVKIMEQDNPQAMLSDENGAFAFEALSGRGMLFFEHLGFEKETAHFNGPSTLLVVMKHTSEHIEEIQVFTGYQTLPRERATGSFEILNNSALQTRTGSGILERIEGLATSVQFDNRRSTPSINVRGINTFSSAMMQPLIILDNFPYQGDLNNINPNDIESVTILKDAAAASIWGARAGNGVIVLTSKKATAAEGIKIDFSNNLNLTEKPDLLYRKDMDASDFIDVEFFLFDKGHYNNAYNGNATTKKNTVFSPVVDMLFAEKEGKIDRPSLNRAVDRFRYIDSRKEMMKLFYRHPFIQQHHISFSHRNQLLSNRISLGYDRHTGAQIGEKSGRLTLQAVTAMDLGKKLSIEARLGYTRSQNDGYLDVMNDNYTVGGGKTRLYPYAEFTDDNGNALPIARNYNLQYLQQLQGTGLLDWLYYPVNESENAVYKGYQNYIQSQLKIDYRLVDGLQLSLLYNMENQPRENESLYRQNSFYARNMINMFTQLKDSDVQHIVPLGGIKNASSATLKAYNVRGQLTYHKNMLDIHKFDLLGGYEVSHRRTNSYGVWVHGYDEELMIAQPVDPLNAYPVYDGLTSNSFIPNAGKTEFSYDTRRFLSAYFNGAYTYGNRYNLSFSARKDGSNVFGVKTNDRWNPLWSAGASWMLHNESAFMHIPWINLLKIRTTYGHSGNAGGQASQLPILMYQNPGYGSLTTLPRAILLSLSNPNLKWEDVRTINVGLDFGLWNNALQGSIEYYNKKSTDLLSTDRLDVTTGFTSITKNVGQLDGRGIDLRLSTNYSFGEVSGHTGFNFSYNYTTVSKFYGTNFRGSNYAENTGKSLNPVLDKQLYPVFSYRFQGLDKSNGDPMGLLKGELSKNYSQLLADSIQNLNYHGTGLPPYYGSLIQKISWKKLSLSFLIAFKLGHYFQKETIRYNSLFNSWISHADYKERWQKPGDENTTTVPSMLYPGNTNRDRFYAASEPNILKGDLVRLQDISVDYQYGGKVLGKEVKVNLFLKANNLGLLWTANKAGLDPDYSSTPAARRYSFGANFNF